jgi:hypothetical protein
MNELRLKKSAGKPFFQREKLTNRIKDILQRYSSTTCIFKELIQNAIKLNSPLSDDKKSQPKP